MSGLLRVAEQTTAIRKALIVSEKDIYKTHSFDELDLLRKKFIAKVEFANNLLADIELN